MTMVTSAVAAPATAATPRGGPKHASADFTSALQGAVHELSATEAAQAAGGDDHTGHGGGSSRRGGGGNGGRRLADQDQAGQDPAGRDPAALLSVPAALTVPEPTPAALELTVPAPADSMTPGPTDSASDATNR